MFALKKIIGTWLMPLPFLLTLFILAALLYKLTRYKRSAQTLFCSSFITLLLLSLDPVATRLAATLESQYPSYQHQAVDYIHVLGNAHTTVDRLPITSQLSPAALARTTEGVRIYKLNPTAKLIFSGYSGGDINSNAKMNARLAIALGVPKSAIILLEQPQDTIEEAIDNKNITQGKQLVLVTSATHMPRAMKIFNQQGLFPIPAPTAHVSKTVTGIQPLHYYFPRAQHLAVSEKVIHEWLGLAWLSLKNNQ
ncbi:envelope biogenesis factor ElyC [Moritella sp. Urea-trap-13]|uniref:envelope biogenesis factor ElyC n=1 Tax=Moritella sp. Urea-trap-13 TaxID=2058327 RepID=UPI000C33BE5B|nr:envelope biogenesis factor ElyC [Moritella sp. Urea-trap-13]PKH07491.1 envelope biogenesis factor ElyC [Moritella sp. Urea-trap-13]